MIHLEKLKHNHLRQLFWCDNLEINDLSNIITF